MAQCVTCGAAFTGNERQLALYFKLQYEQKGIGRYVYKLPGDEGYSFVRSTQFNAVFQDKIKPQLDNGAEYYHIREFE